MNITNLKVSIRSHDVFVERYCVTLLLENRSFFETLMKKVLARESKTE